MVWDPLVPATVLILVAVQLCISLVYNWILKPQGIPGPPVPPCFGHFFAFRQRWGNPLPELLRWAYQYGSPLQFTQFGGQKVVLLNTVEQVQYVVNDGLEGGKFGRGPLLNEQFRDVLGSGILTVDGDEYKHMRNILQGMLHSSKLEEFIAVWHSKAHQLVEVLLQESQANTVSVFDRGEVEAQQLMSRYAADCLGEMVFGCSLHALHGGAWLFLRDLQYLLNACYSRDKYGKWWQWLWHDKAFTPKLRAVEDFVQGLVRQQRQLPRSELKKRKDILSRLLVDKGSPSMANMKVEDDRSLGQFLLSIFVAGLEPSATMLSWTFYCLGKYPETQGQITKEIKKVRLEAGQVAEPDTHVDQEEDEPKIEEITEEAQEAMAAAMEAPREVDLLTFDNIRKLNHLRQTVLETLRCYPPRAFIQYSVLKNDCLPSGHDVTPGMRVAFSPYLLHQSTASWGFPDKFMPERFEQRPKSWQFAAFNGGARRCIGQETALLLGLATFSVVLREHQVILNEAEAKGDVQQSLKPSGLLSAHNGIHIKLVQLPTKP